MALRVDHEVIGEQSGLLLQQHERFEDVLKECTTLIHNLVEVWEGEASEAFIEQWDAISPKLSEGLNLVHQIGIQLGEASAALGEADGAVADQVRKGF